MNVLGTAGEVVHELLEVSVDVLKFAPIVGLEEAARTLLNIWDALQLVDVSPAPSSVFACSPCRRSTAWRACG